MLLLTIGRLNGGQPFVDLFSKPFNQSITVLENSYEWIFRQDNSGTPTSIFSGVVDFEVIGGSVQIQDVCYLNFDLVKPELLQYEGYIKRIDPPNDHEARVFKGSTPVTEVTTYPLFFTINDTVSRGTILPIAYPLFDIATQTYGDPVLSKGWFSNVNPHSYPLAVTSDMVTFYMPSFGYLDPRRCCDGAGFYPNAGNWAIVYNIKGSVSNTGHLDRWVNLNMTLTDSIAPVAFKSNSSAPWRQVLLVSNNNLLTYGTIFAPAQSTTPFEVSYVLGGPASGGEYHFFWTW